MEKPTRKKCPPQPSCAFTSGLSTLEGTGKAGKCAANKRGHSELLLVCHSCLGSNDPVYRCTSCYLQFKTAIKERMPTLPDKQWQERLPPVLKNLLDIDWQSLCGTEVAHQPQAISALNLIDRADADYQVELIDRRFMLAWRGACPCCYDFELPPPPPVVLKLATPFAALEPEVTRCCIDLEKVAVMDKVTGLYCTVDVRLFVDTAVRVVTREQVCNFKHRYGDEPEHKNYKWLSLSDKERRPAHEGQEVWHLVRSGGKESIALSFSWTDALVDCFMDERDPRNFRKLFGRIHRESAPYKKLLSGKVPKDVKTLVKTRPLRDCSLRANRVGGPFGHGNGLRVSTIRQDVVSPYLDNCLPRNNPCAVICVPMCTKEGLYTGMIPFYVAATPGGTTSNTATVVTQPRHCAIPRHSTVATGKRLVDRIESVSSEKERNMLLSFVKTFTCAIYRGAYILERLGNDYPELVASSDAVKVTLENERRRRAVFISGEHRSATRDTATRTREHFVVGLVLGLVSIGTLADTNCPQN